MALNKLYLFIGGRGEGKTTACLKVAQKSKYKDLETGDVLNKRIIVLDDIVHPAYSEFDKINHTDLKQEIDKNTVVFIEDLDSALLDLGHHQANAFVIVEDSSRYINASISNSVRRFIVNHRKINVDIAFMFHSIKEVPPYLATNYNRMILFRTGDNIEVNQPKWLNWEEIKAAHKKVMKSKKSNDCVVIDKG